jgi:hypothetical protein
MLANDIFYLPRKKQALVAFDQSPLVIHITQYLEIA